MIESIAAKSRPLRHMPPVAQYRRDNVITLIERLDGGIAKNFIERTGLCGLPLYIANPPWRNFGPQLARRIEEILAIESGILDIPQAAINVDLSHSGITPAKKRQCDLRPTRTEPKHRFRQRNLSDLITFLTNGALKEFESLFGLSYLSNRLSKNAPRKIGDIVASRIEKAMSLPAGTLDQEGVLETMINAAPLPDTLERVHDACQKLTEQLRWRLSTYDSVCEDLGQIRHSIQQELIAIAREDGYDRDALLFDTPDDHLPELSTLRKQCTVLMEDSPTSNSVCVIMPVAYDRESRKHLARAQAALDEVTDLTPHLAWRSLVPSGDNPWELSEYHGRQRVGGAAPATRTRLIQSLTRAESISQKLESLRAATDSELLDRSWFRRTAKNLASAAAALHTNASGAGSNSLLLTDAEARSIGITSAITNLTRVLTLRESMAIVLPLGPDSLQLPEWRDALNEQLKANPDLMAALPATEHNAYAMTMIPMATLLREQPTHHQQLLESAA